MGARHKLNTGYVWGCLIVSAFFGLAADSWGVFWGVLLVTIGGCYVSGDIRPDFGARQTGVGPGAGNNRRSIPRRRS